jgi:hypothetical protein
MNWQAIGIGAAVGIVAGLAWNMAVTSLLTVLPDAWSWLRWLGYAVGIVLDLAVGATAGWLAAKRGAEHGALADVGAIVLGFAVSLVLQLARGQDVGYLRDSAYWGEWTVAVVPGIALAALAGWAAAALSAARAGRSATTPS